MYNITSLCLSSINSRRRI